MIETSIFNDFLKCRITNAVTSLKEQKENLYEQIKLKLITVTMPLCCQLQNQRLKQRNAHPMLNVRKTNESEKQSSFKRFESPSMLFALFLPLCQ